MEAYWGLLLGWGVTESLIDTARFIHCSPRFWEEEWEPQINNNTGSRWQVPEGNGRMAGAWKRLIWPGAAWLWRSCVPQCMVGWEDVEEAGLGAPALCAADGPVSHGPFSFLSKLIVTLRVRRLSFTSSSKIKHWDKISKLPPWGNITIFAILLIYFVTHSLVNYFLIQFFK